MIDWYQHIPECINPVVFTIGFFSLYWYATMYVFAIGVSGFVMWRNVKGWLAFDQYIDLVFNLATGVLIGSRMGYVLLYNFSFYATHPLAVVWPFDAYTGAWVGIAGMSYYGGFIGAVAGLWLFIRRYKFFFWRVADVLAFSVPFGYFFGRMGNFLNGELYGRVTDRVWGMYFPYADAGSMMLRHPSQLYEAFFEGAAVLIILLFVRRRYHFVGASAAAYVIGYNFFRFGTEFFREPDPQIGLVYGSMTIGHIISAVACVIGIGLFFRLRGKCDTMEDM